MEKGNLSHFLGICLQYFEKNAPPFSLGWQRCRRKARNLMKGISIQDPVQPFPVHHFCLQCLVHASALVSPREDTLNFLLGLRDLALEFSEQGQADGTNSYLDFLVISFFHLPVTHLASQRAGAFIYYVCMQL